MQELLKDEIENFGDDFGKLEQAVMAKIMSFGKGLLQRAVDCGPNGYDPSLSTNVEYWHLLLHFVGDNDVLVVGTVVLST